MKTKVMTMIVTLMWVIAANGSNQKVTANIKHVTVFSHGAQVERTYSMNLTAGEHVVTFTGLSPYTDVKSMQIKARGKLTVLGVSYRTIHPDSLLQIKKLHEAEQKLKQITEKERELKARLDVINTQMELVKTNCSTANRATITPLTNIKELNNYYAQETFELKKKAIDIDKELTMLGEKQEKQEKTVDSIAHLKLKTVTEADLKLLVSQASKAEFDLSYYVRNAGWYPTYDIRSEGLNRPLQLSYKANIFQNTNEDWNNLPITLSSANPNRSNVAPELRTYWINFGKQAPHYDETSNTEGNVSGFVFDELGVPLIGCTVTVLNTSLTTITDIDGRYSISLPHGKNKLRFDYIGYLSQTCNVNNSTMNVKMEADKSGLDEVVVIGYGGSKKGRKNTRKKEEDNGVVMKSKEAIVENVKLSESKLIDVNEQKAQFGYEFDIKQSLTLSSNGNTTTTEIARYQLPATYQYLGIPRADKEAFLVADAIDWQQYNLLEGEANIYFENSFVGKTILDPTTTNDTLHFSLGRDNGIRIQRTKVAARSTRRLLALNQEQDMTWRITVKNSRKEAVSLTLQDQIPVSENSTITVTTEELSGGQIDKATGIITWLLQLQPNEQREFIVQYRVKYPRSRHLIVE